MCYEGRRSSVPWHSCPKNENALEKLVDDCRMEKAEIEARHQSERGRLVNIFAGKKCRMIMRWKLQEIERKKLEKDPGKTYGPLPSLIFPELATATSEGDDGVETPVVAVNVTPALQPVSI
jgi:hypothetical protein